MARTPRIGLNPAPNFPKQKLPSEAKLKEVYAGYLFTNGGSSTRFPFRKPRGFDGWTILKEATIQKPSGRSGDIETVVAKVIKNQGRLQNQVVFVVTGGQLGGKARYLGPVGYMFLPRGAPQA